MAKRKPSPLDILDAFAARVHAPIPFRYRHDGSGAFAIDRWCFSTRFGPLHVSYVPSGLIDEAKGNRMGNICEPFIAARFTGTDAELAAAVKALPWDRVNPHCGKWNHHTFDYATEDQRRTKAGRLAAEYAMVNAFVAAVFPLLTKDHGRVTVDDETLAGMVAGARF